jgi:hypothetical protein
MLFRPNLVGDLFDTAGGVFVTQPNHPRPAAPPIFLPPFTSSQFMLYFQKKVH